MATEAQKARRKRAKAKRKLRIKAAAHLIHALTRSQERYGRTDEHETCVEMLRTGNYIHLRAQPGFRVTGVVKPTDTVYYVVFDRLTHEIVTYLPKPGAST